jgi:hypothetical protein
MSVLGLPFESSKSNPNRIERAPWGRGKGRLRIKHLPRASTLEFEFSIRVSRSRVFQSVVLDHLAEFQRRIGQDGRTDITDPTEHKIRWRLNVPIYDNQKADFAHSVGNSLAELEDTLVEFGIQDS